MIQTRWHRDDLTGRILRQAEEKERKWRVVKFPALAEEEGVLGRQQGEPLWPEVFTKERLETIRSTKTNYYWQAMYQQNPQAEGSTEWPDSFFGPDIWFNEWPDHWQCKVVALDPSKGVESKFGDYSAFAKVMASDGILYVDADLAIRNTSVITDTAIEIQRRFQPDWFGIEANQFQQLMADDIRRRSEDFGVPLPLYTIQNQVNKVVRIRRLTPLLSQGQLRFKGDSPGARLLVEQLRDFPNGDHDDGPDALEMALRLGPEILNDLPVPEEVLVPV